MINQVLTWLKCLKYVKSFAATYSSHLEKKWNLQVWSTKKPHLWKKHFHGSTLAMTFKFSIISKINLETSVDYLQRHFHNHSTCFFFFFLEKTTDRQIDLLFWVLRYPAQYADLELRPEPAQNKNLLQITSKIYAFLLFLRNLLACNLKVFVFMK